MSRRSRRTLFGSLVFGYAAARPPTGSKRSVLAEPGEFTIVARIAPGFV